VLLEGPGAAGSGAGAWQRLSIAGELIDNLARFVPDDDDRSGLIGPAIFQKLIYDCTSGPNGGLVARHERSFSIVDFLIRIRHGEEVARHPLNIWTMPRKEKSPDRTAKLPRLKLTIGGRVGWPTIGQLGMFAVAVKAGFGVPRRKVVQTRYQGVDSVGLCTMDRDSASVLALGR
jgi:hypothetical protein